MSVKELDLREGNQLLQVRHPDQGYFTLAICDARDYKQIGLDYNQAYLLMLYLQEHLKIPSTIGKGLDDAITDELNNPPKDIMK